MVEKYASAYIIKGIASVNAHVHMNLSVDRCKQTTSASSTTFKWDTRKTLSPGSARVVGVVRTHIQIGGRHSISTDAVVAEKYMA